jgi:hypothetical protein
VLEMGVGDNVAAFTSSLNANCQNGTGDFVPRIKIDAISETVSQVFGQLTDARVSEPISMPFCASPMKFHRCGGR